MLDFLKNMGGVEWLIIGIVLLVLFGNKKMKEVAKSAGEATKELKKAKDEFTDAKAEVVKTVREKEVAK